MTTEQQARRRLAKALVALRRRDAVFAYTASTLVKVADDTQPTAWTDGKHLGFNCQHVLDIPLEECISLLAHEAEHVVKGDPWRMHLWLQRVAAMAKAKGGDQVALQKYNEGSDHGINLRLERNGYQLGNDWLKDAAFDKVAAEVAATQLLEAMPDPQPQQKPQQQQQGQQQQGDQGQQAGDQGQPGDGQGQGQENAQNGSQAAPSNGQAQPQGQQGQAQAQGGQAPSSGQVRPFPTAAEPGTPAAIKEAKRGYSKLKKDMANAKRYAEGCGCTNEGTMMEVEQVLAVRLDWDALLREFMVDRVPEDYSWARPQRDYMLRGIYMPTLHSEALGDVLLVADTSGSMDREAFDECAGHVHQICTELGARLKVLYVDTAIRGEQDLTADDSAASLQPVGGGGTDFRPAFKWLAEQDEYDPACVVYFTDLECTRFPEPHAVDVPVLWVQWGTYNAPPVPFGEVVVLPQERSAA